MRRNPKIFRIIGILIVIVFLSEVPFIANPDILRQSLLAPKSLWIENGNGAEPEKIEPSPNAPQTQAHLTQAAFAAQRRNRTLLFLGTSIFLHLLPVFLGFDIETFLGQPKELPSEDAVEVQLQREELPRQALRTEESASSLDKKITNATRELEAAIGPEGLISRHYSTYSSPQVVLDFFEFYIPRAVRHYTQIPDIKDYEERYTKATGKELDAQTRTLLERYLQEVRNPSISESELKDLYNKLMYSPYNVSYGFGFGLFQQYSISPHGLRGTMMFKLLNLMVKEEGLSSLKAKYPSEWADFRIIYDFLEGRLRIGDSKVKEAFARLESDLEKIRPDFEKGYETMRQVQVAKIQRDLSKVFQDISREELIKWFEARGLEVVFDGIEREEIKKLNLVIAYEVFRQLPAERGRGIKIVFNSEGETSYFIEKDWLNIDLKDYLEMQALRHINLRKIYSVIFHELAHRWQLKELDETLQSEFVNISWSWEKYLEIEELKKKETGTIYIESPSEDSDLERDFIVDEDVMSGWTSSKEDLATTVGDLYYDYEAVVKKAINNLIQYRDPDLAQKIFFAYGYYGKVLSPDLWIVRADNAPVNQDEGVYVYKIGGKIFQVTLTEIEGGIDTEVIEIGDFKPDIFIRELVKRNTKKLSYNPLQSHPGTMWALFEGRVIGEFQGESSITSAL